MSLKLFRSTGFSSILFAGETRAAVHPRWMVLATSIWVGFACNVALWQALFLDVAAGRGLAWALTAGFFAAAASGALLSLLGWRRTFKPTATLLLLLAAIAACGAWFQSLPLDASLLGDGLTALVPAWPSLLRWEVPALLVMLGLLPMLWLWNTKVRRLPGPEQLGVNIAGMAASAAVLGISGYLLTRAL